MKRSLLALLVVLASHQAAAQWVSGPRAWGPPAGLTWVQDYVTLPSTCTPFTLLVDSDADTTGQLNLCGSNGQPKTVGGGGSGTVTSVGNGTIGSLFSASWATATTTPALSFDFAAASANTFLAGPTSGGAAVPTARALVSADLGSFTLQPSLRNVTVQPPDDTPTATFRRFGAAQTACLVRFDQEDNSNLSCIDKAGAFTGNAATASAVAVAGITGLGTGVGTWLATPSSANLAAAVTDETGSGALVFGTSPTFTTSAFAPYFAASSYLVIGTGLTSSDTRIDYTGGVVRFVDGTGASTFRAIAALNGTFSGSGGGDVNAGRFVLPGSSILRAKISAGDGFAVTNNGATAYEGLSVSSLYLFGAGTTFDTGITRDAAGVTAATDGSTGLGSYRIRGSNASSNTWSGSAGEALTLSTGGTTTNTSASLAPANSRIKAITARITTTITTATDWSVSVTSGITACTTAWVAIGTATAAQTTLTAGTTVIFQPASGLSCHVGSASTLTVTTTGTPGAGAIRLVPFYETFAGPTS